MIFLLILFHIIFEREKNELQLHVETIHIFWPLWIINDFIDCQAAAFVWPYGSAHSMNVDQLPVVSYASLGGFDIVNGDFNKADMLYTYIIKRAE